MRYGILGIFAILTASGLGGCGGGGYGQLALQPQPGQEILDGTVRNPKDWQEAPPAAAPRKVTRRAPRETVGTSEISASAQQQPIVYSEEWWAKEKQEDARLKRQMTICRGC